MYWKELSYLYVQDFHIIDTDFSIIIIIHCRKKLTPWHITLPTTLPIKAYGYAFLYKFFIPHNVLYIQKRIPVSFWNMTKVIKQTDYFTSYISIFYITTCMSVVMQQSRMCNSRTSSPNIIILYYIQLSTCSTIPTCILIIYEL